MKLFIALTVGIFFARNFFIPISADDYVYLFIWNFETFAGKADDWILISSFTDIFKSQVEHYFYWGGRTIAHAVVQLFLWQGKIFFNVANTIVATIFVWIIIKLSGKVYDWKIFVTVICLWIFLPQFVPTMLWLTGSCNYLWLTTLQLTFLYTFINDKPRIYIPLGIFAGWSNEAGAISIWILSAVYLRIKKTPIEFHQLLGLILFSIGLCLLMFSPGNFNRAENYEVNFAVNFYTFAELILKSVPMLIIIALSNKSKWIIFFTAGGFIPLIAMLFSPEFPPRSIFLSPVLFLIAMLISLESLSWKKNLLWLLNFIFICTFFLSLYSDIRVHQKYLSRQMSEVVPKVQASHRIESLLGERIITQQILDNDPTADENYNYNRAMAKFYGLSKIRRED